MIFTSQSLNLEPSSPKAESQGGSGVPSPDAKDSIPSENRYPESLTPKRPTPKGPTPKGPTSERGPATPAEFREFLGESTICV
jgi:hypothetical protein